MRPVRPGYYGPDLAAVARVRRRIASDEAQPVSWRRDMITHLDALHAGLEAVITEAALGPLNKGREQKKPAKPKPLGAEG